MKMVLCCLVLFFISLSAVGQNAEFLNKLKSLSTEQLNTLKIPTSSIKEYTAMSDYAITLYKDKTNKDNKLKGELILSVIADTLTRKIADKSIDAFDPDVSLLRERLQECDFIIPLPKVSDFLKLARHACEGDYGYIHSRFKEKWYYIPSISALCIFVIFSIINLLGLVKWKFRKKYNILLLILIGFLIVITIIFKNTCDKYVTERSFYGIRF